MSHKLEDFLTKFATIFFDIMCDKKTTLISRIIIMEGPKNGGKLSRDFLDQILSRVDKILIDFFNQGDIKSQLNPNIPIDKLAPLFTALIRNPYHYDSVVLNEPINLTTLEKKEHIKMCVSLFLDGILKR
jgi:transcription regulator protein